MKIIISNYFFNSVGTSKFIHCYCWVNLKRFNDQLLIYDSKHVSDMIAYKLPQREFKGLLNFVWGRE